MWRPWFLSSMTFLILAPVLAGQAVEVRSTSTVTLNLRSNSQVLKVPFLERFILTVPLIRCARAVYLIPDPENSHTRLVHDEINVDTAWVNPTDVSFPIRELPPDEDVRFHLEYDVMPDSTGAPCKKGGATVRVRQPRRAGSRFVLDPASSATHHIDLDVGVLGSLNARYVGLALLAHVHAVPLNENTPEWLGGGLSRFSLFGGFSILEIHSEDDVMAPFGVGVPVVGAAMSFGHVRILGGVMFFDQADANPLVDERRAKVDFLAGASIDLALAKVLGSVAAVLGIK